jgi:type I restriction enzyme S subunit
VDLKVSESSIPEVFKTTELCGIPEGWKVVRLRDVTEKTKQKNPRKTPELRFKYVDVSSISRDALKIVECKLYQGKDAPSRAKKLVRNDDVIFATVRPTLKRLTLIDEEFNGEICSTAFCVLRAMENILNPLYMFYAVQKDVFIDELGKVQRGASYPAVTDSDVKYQKILLPPLPEQHRIAAVLSAVQDAKEKTGAVIAAAKLLKKSLMRHLFTYGPVPAGAAERVPLKETEIGLVPEGWGILNVGGAGKVVTGTTPRTSMPEYYGGAYMFTSPGDIGEEMYVKKAEKYISEKGLNVSRPLPRDTVLVVCIGATIGKTALTSAEQSTTNQQINAIIPNENVFAHYLYYAISHRAPYLPSLAGRAAVPIVNKSNFANFPIPLPPRPTQKKIASILSTVDKKIESEENKKKALDELFRSLLHNLMTGKIRVNHLEVTQ